MCDRGPERTITHMTTTTTKTSFLRRLLGPVQSIDAHAPALTLRYAGPADTDELDRLAQLDSTRAPRGAVLVAEVDGELWAAISLDDHHSVSDPFRPTGELVALLVQRARQLRRSRRGRLDGLPRVWPHAGYDRPAIS
jgi:hypothetical protein